MTTSRSAQDWRDSWRELRPHHLSWMQRQSRKIIAAERPDQIEEFIWKHRGHRFTDEEIQGLRDGSIREAVKDWWETTVRLAKERRLRERQDRLAAFTQVAQLADTRNLDGLGGAGRAD